MLLIAGLRNPEPLYDGTRHNVGAEVVEELARRWTAPLRRGPLRVRADVAQANIQGQRAVLALPRASMNVCGPAVAAATRYFKVGPDDLVVVHDDIDLPFGRLRLHAGRGSGGHNGVKSVVQALGTGDFHRLKIGIGRPPGRMDPADYVLRRFTRAEREEVDFLVLDAADVVETFLVDRDEAVQRAGGRRPHEGG